MFFQEIHKTTVVNTKSQASYIYQLFPEYIINVIITSLQWLH